MHALGIKEQFSGCRFYLVAARTSCRSVPRAILCEVMFRVEVNCFHERERIDGSTVL